MDRQPVSYIVILFIISLLIVLFLGAAIVIINPGLLTRALPHVETPIVISPIVASRPSPVAGATVATSPATSTANPLAAVTAGSTMTATRIASPAVSASLTATVTATSLPTRTPTHIPTATVPLNPDRAQFVTDVSVPDGTQMTAGQQFTKTWQIKNVGTTTWTTQFDLEFTSGSIKPVQRQVSFPNDVAPGDMVNLSIDLIAPDTPGQHTSVFQFRDAQGIPFGVGPLYNQPIYVTISVVTDQTPTP